MKHPSMLFVIFRLIIQPLCKFTPHIINDAASSAPDWIENAARKLPPKVLDLLLNAIWLICSSRNNHQHCGLHDFDFRLASKINLFYQEFANAQAALSAPIQARTFRTFWKPPTLFKLTSMHHSLPVTQGGAGIVVGDNEGFVLGAASRLIAQPHSPVAAKATAAVMALETAADVGFCKIMIEGHCLTVIKALRDVEPDLSEIGFPETSCLVSNKCLVSFSRRDTNNVAHLLAKQSIKKKE